MTSLLLHTLARYVSPIQLAVSVYLLLRGHNEPGGGFVAGLIAASALLLYGMSAGFERMEEKMPVGAVALVWSGLSLALLSGLSAVIFERPFFSALWIGKIWIPIVGDVAIGSVLFFDVGVYLLVTGFATQLAVQFSREATSK